MTSLPLNPDGDRRDRLIFGKPLDWQTQAAQQRRVSFDKLPLCTLEQLIQEGFVQASEQPLSDPDALELVEVARCLSRPTLSAWVEVLVSPPACQEWVRITAIRFEGMITPVERSFFWRSFYHVRALEMTPRLLRATFDSAALLFVSHPVVAYQDVVPWDLSEPGADHDPRLTHG
ncbi:hypothetical protein [Leptolyngbya sp. NIES-2104]|uniref:hypothetical protein n=1 Tax=Leptolyngbya sp. NIES-2104 TaxID=1552121 RepID=UPI00073ECCAC|nr:hypothetical protein [Leptolyngbya sp. NIES-2104]